MTEPRSAYAERFPTEAEVINHPAGKKVTVAGLGFFGGGLGVARYFAKRGAKVLVTDLKDANALVPALAGLEGLSVDTVLGRHRDADFVEADLVVASPAIPPEAPILAVARAAGVPVSTEICVFLAACPTGHLVGVSGSNGKSTTAAAIASLLESLPEPVFLGGNIGGSLLEQIDEIGTADRVVLELSSFQLESLDRARFAPEIAVLTNVTPNHLDRHKSFDQYVDAKRSLVRHQSPRQHKVLFRDDESLDHFGRADCGKARISTFGTRDDGRHGYFLDPIRKGGYGRRETGEEVHLFSDCEVQLRGRFNRLNLLAASAVAQLCGVGPAQIRSGTRAFAGVPHRLERVGSIDEVSYFNDSVSTTPQSTAAALEAFRSDEVVLIAGGYDKGISLAPLAEAAVKFASAIVLIGQTAPLLETQLRELLGPDGGPGQLRLCRAQTFDDALFAARALARPGARVLLSPGCASYDMFENYVERGERFRAFVEGGGIARSGPA